MMLIFPRKFVYSMYEWIKGYKTSRGLNLLRKTQWFSEDEAKKFQWSRLENLLRYIYKNIPFYTNLFNNIGIDIKNGISIDDFRKIPLLNKEIINKNREILLSKQFKLSELIVDMTSGSTGEKLVFYREKKRFKTDYYLKEAASQRCIEWLEFNRFDKQAFLWGSQMNHDTIKRIKDKLANFLFPSLFLSSYNLTPEVMNSYRKKIVSFNPKILIGYASALYVFASYLDEKKIDIHGLKGVVSTAETIQQFQKEKIEKVFNCKVFELYGSREFGTIAQECIARQGLHVSTENVFLEIVDEEGISCKPGKSGKIVITDLDNYCFPFVRYDIGDIGILSNRKCLCGRGLPLIEKIEGRTWDVIIGTNGNQLVGSFWLVKGIEGINQFQLIQEELGKLILNLVVDRSFTELEKNKLLERIYNNCGKDMKVDIELIDEIPLTESGKRRFIISKVSPYIK